MGGTTTQRDIETLLAQVERSVEALETLYDRAKASETTCQTLLGGCSDAFLLGYMRGAAAAEAGDLRIAAGFLRRQLRDAEEDTEPRTEVVRLLDVHADAESGAMGVAGR